jgi:small subunit ribosomal protein S14
LGKGALAHSQSFAKACGPSLEKGVAPAQEKRNSTFLIDTYMAKTSWIEREKKKAATVAKFAALRAELKAKGDYIGLSLLPRNASPVRMSKRCLQSGRKRAYIGRFKLSRIAFRELASNGLIPGVTKSSW